MVLSLVAGFELFALVSVLSNVSLQIIGKLCGQHFIPVPIVKAVFYTTEFVLKNLGLQRQKKPIEETESEDYSLMIQSELLGFDFEKVIKTERLKKSAKTEDESLKLYSYFFSGSSTPGKSDLLDFITKLLENFINTFLLGRPTDRHKHFFKVGEWDISVYLFTFANSKRYILSFCFLRVSQRSEDSDIGRDDCFFFFRKRL